MVDVTLNKLLFYAIADAVCLPMVVSKRKVSGSRRLPVQIGPGVEFMFPVDIVSGCYDDAVAGVLIQGPGDMQIIVYSEYLGPNIQTHLFIIDKAKLSPVTAFPTKTPSLTLKNIKALYGPSVALHCSRENTGTKPEDWTVHP